MSFNIPQTDKKRIVIIGGGFGGLQLANKLKNTNFQIVLIDKNNYHQFPPLLYQVASSGLEYNSISFPFRKIFYNRKNFYFRLAEVNSVIAEKNLIITSIGELTYDYLILAAGTTTNFFGNKAIQANSLPMKTIEEALLLRDTLLLHLEKAAICTDPEEKQAFLNVVIVGGGATGVEVAGALSEMKRFVLPKDYPDLGKFNMNIYLIEASPKLLGVMSTKASSNSKRFLEDMGVNILLNKKVVDYKEGKVILDDGETIATKTLLWVSGVKAVHFQNINENLLSRGGRIIVNEFNQVKGIPNVFAIGDICYQTEEQYPNGHPQVAQVAIQQGALLATNIQRMEAGKEPVQFHYKNLGTLATIGRNKAVADLNKIKLQGFTAWLVWMFVHLRSILGIKNKLVILIDWIWNYFTYDRSMRFILFIGKRKQDE
ncbi:NAD(P)/FAD-dependent oxidoreductase [Parabacteroides provencensis]|uniref:NAD(P)/FAD-dependent oxidoreductase n=1 Tax=Parabacteroides provencensis TaxID=1944636 RepID=UPI000C155113|nr:NAD(P)/FAD-dependent oxidoreductase [Parabacteroides provencensis]